MKALGVTEIPEGDWQLELKFDGYRALTAVGGGEVEIWSRNHLSLAADYPEVVNAVRELAAKSALLDGEIVALDPQGVSRFQLLQRRELAEARPPIAYYVFDLLEVDGRSLRDQPIEQRRAELEKLLPPKHDVLRLSPVFRSSPADLLAHVRKLGLEGIVAKTPGSPYEVGARSGSWLKCRVTTEQEFVIGGFTPPQGARAHFGALLVGYYADDKLLYAGKVGTGFDTKLLAALAKEFAPLEQTACPFANLPATRTSHFATPMNAAAMRTVHWLRPKLVCQVRFAEWTQDGLLRQPVFLGLRRDKRANQVVREITPDRTSA